MNFDIYYNSKNYSWLCFRHAVQEANKGHRVETNIIDTRDYEYYTGDTSCTLCDIEALVSDIFYRAVGRDVNMEELEHVVENLPTQFNFDDLMWDMKMTEKFETWLEDKFEYE